jgi:K(+)-stimulated pyrophosphate-energized sodium pump
MKMVFAALANATAFEATTLWTIFAVAIAGLVYAVILTIQILREDKGNEKMQKVARAIQVGANAYLRKQFKTIVLLIVFLAIALYLTAPTEAIAGVPSVPLGRSLAFLMGAAFSASVGYIGMNMAVRGNVRVAAAARKNFADALRIGYRTGTITGMLTDGLGLLGGTLIFLFYGQYAAEALLGFGFGGTLLALFMRVGGGIYTKAADVGADMVGKVEKGIPEDDPRNPAVIADLVGDNVGDCAGMAADIFESYEVTIVSAMILGYAAFGFPGVIFPLMVRAMGVLGSIIGTYAVRAKGKVENAMRAINRGFTLSAVITVIGFLFFAYFYMHDLRVFFATFTGILLAISVNQLTEHFTSAEKGPVKGIIQSTKTGTATNILSGLAVGYEATVWAIFTIAAAIIASVIIFSGEPFVFALYGVALCGIGMLTLTGNNISMDAFGPISDNANGIGEMAGLTGKPRRILASLDSVGNTTKAITKGIAIGSAVIAAVALFGSFIEVTGLKEISISNPYVFVGLLIGGAIPFLFSSLTIRAVSRSASQIITEVRRQFHSIRGLMQGKAEPDYARCVQICTAAAQRELIGLGLLAILTPIIVGFLLHEEALGGFLAGVILTGQLLAVFMSTSGASWDNTKKAIEDGLLGGKGSDAHKSSVIGDTVGDPLKDTAGPALNPMIKVINLVSLLIAPLVVASKGFTIVTGLVVIVMIGAVAAAIWYSKKEAYI